MPGEGTPEARIVVVGERRPAVTCGVGGRLRVDVGESSPHKAEAPSRGRKPLLQAGVRVPVGDEIILQTRG